MVNRCAWANVNDPLLRRYHDNEWGRPLHDSQKLFELLSLEMMQAGLSWRTVLHKQKAFEDDFHNFDYRIVMKMMPELPKLLKDSRIIRNRLKLKAIINNAKVVDKLNRHSVDLNHYLWKFVNHRPIVNHYRTHDDVPTKTPLAVKMSRQMKRDGFNFMGPVTIYSFMEASGMVDDHTMDCFLRG